jgi:hypothetical protein
LHHHFSGGGSEIAEKPHSSGAQAPNVEQNPAKAGFFSRIYPALIIVGGLIPRRTAFFSDLNQCFPLLSTFFSR